MKDNRIFRLFSKVLLLLCISSCGVDNIDPHANLTRDEAKYTIIKDKREKTVEEKTREFETKKEEIPAISKLLVSPPPPPIGSGKLISFSVTEDVPLKDVIIELGRIADIDIEVDPQITGGIILKATQKPLEVIVERICELGNLRYSYTNNILRFERDTPYSLNYTADFLITDALWTSIQNSLQDILTNRGDTTAKINLNKEANIITVYANSKSQKAISQYIDEAKRNYSAQVLIEAKIVEVELTDEFKAGIDWGWDVKHGDWGVDVTAAPDIDSGTKGLFAGVISNSNLTSTVQMLETFGVTKTLSSPRIHAINNQEAKLEFTDLLVYFSVERDVTAATDTTAQVTEYTTTKEEDTEGITLTITPSINLETQEITMDVVPELRAKIGEIEDPNPDIENLVPLIQTRKMTTSLKLKSGGIMVIGGLMSETTDNQDNGVPFLNKIPVLGYLFKATERESSVTETVIFLKATIVDSDGGVNKYDQEFYDKFSPVRSPLI